MDKHTLYTPPTTEVIQLQGQEHLLQLSNYGNPGSAGGDFDSGDILDGGLFGIMGL